MGNVDFTQPIRPLSEDMDMTITDNAYEWFDLEQDHGVLELDQALTTPGPALEMDVHLTEDGVIAFWLTDAGTMLRPVEVGEA